MTFTLNYFQVVFVQSIQGSETLTVVPLDEQSNTLQLTHHGAQSHGTSDLSAGLSALPSVSQLQQHLPQELTVKQVEAMLNKGLLMCFVLFLHNLYLLLICF